MKKDGTKYLALIQFPNGKEEWMIIHWGKPPAFFDVHQKTQWVSGMIPPKIKQILKYYELSDVIEIMENNEDE